MSVPANSPAGELVAALSSWPSPNVSPERRALVLANVLDRGRPGRSVLALLRPAVVLIAVLSLGVAAGAATIGPRLARRWFADAPAVSIDLPAVQPAVTPARVRAVPPAESPPELQPPRARAARTDSPARVAAAVRALRVEHQPVRAERLALDYLRVYPRGALVEEALAVAIEAAALNHDSRAPRLAERYFRQYPNGRFRRVAQQVRSP